MTELVIPEQRHTPVLLLDVAVHSLAVAREEGAEQRGADWTEGAREEKEIEKEGQQRSEAAENSCGEATPPREKKRKGKEDGNKNAVRAQETHKRNGPGDVAVGDDDDALLHDRG